VSFASLAQPAVDPIIERFAAAPAVTIVVGAGASMEADLRSWPELIRRLLERVARENLLLKRAADRKDWIERTLARDELLGAGAVVEVLADEDLESLLPEALYAEAGPAGYEPGPIADQVAQLRMRFGDQLTILTTNYDDLIERALLGAGAGKRQIRSYVQRRAQLPSAAIPVTHLHGYAGREDKPKALVLTEEQYHRMQRGRSWQEEYVTERLENSLCLFIGTSLTDPNLIRYLYGYRRSSRGHAAVFVRQGDLEHATPVVRGGREEAIRRRWQRCGVEPVFVDHYADAAQLLYEIGHRRDSSRPYEPVAARAARTIRQIERTLSTPMQAMTPSPSDRSFFRVGSDRICTRCSRPRSTAGHRPVTSAWRSLYGCSVRMAPASRVGRTATAPIRTRPPLRRSRSPLEPNGSPSAPCAGECVSN
jgi:hypothetical protein